MSPLSTADLDGFLEQLMDSDEEIDARTLRLVLARNRMDLVSVDAAPAPPEKPPAEARAKIEKAGAAKLLERMREHAVRVRVGMGPVQDGVLLDDIEGDYEDLIPDEAEAL